MREYDDSELLDLIIDGKEDQIQKLDGEARTAVMVVTAPVVARGSFRVVLSAVIDLDRI